MDRRVSRACAFNLISSTMNRYSSNGEPSVSLSTPPTNSEATCSSCSWITRTNSPRKEFMSLESDKMTNFDISEAKSSQRCGDQHTKGLDEGEKVESRFARCATGMAADLAAVCCCCPLAVLHLLACVFVKCPIHCVSKTAKGRSATKQQLNHVDDDSSTSRGSSLGFSARSHSLHESTSAISPRFGDHLNYFFPNSPGDNIPDREG